jgi:opacity protein-like surface antigen
MDRSRRHRFVVAVPALAGALVSLLALASSSALVAQEPGWSVSVYAQESFPKQTRTNAQIDQINAMFGTGFDTWDDIHNLSLGAKLFRRVAPRWWLGLEADWSAGAIDGKATVDTLAGPATLKFEQRYSVYADLMAAAHFLPCPDCRRFEPFVLMGAGVAYEKDRTTLTLRNEYLDEGLSVDNDGWFPVATAGLGAQIPLTARRNVALEVGVAYFWGRLEHKVPANGSLAPAPEVTADTDSTGPNYWLGVSWRFGAPRR